MLRTTKPALLALSAAACVAIAACRQQAGPDTGNEAPVELPLPPLPVAEPPLDRAGLLHAAALAASAAALGEDDRRSQRELDGKRFEVRIRFGCGAGAAPPGEAPFSIRYEPEKRALRVRAAPDLTGEEDWIVALGGEAVETVEAVEGFWMRRPWLLASGCPRIAQPPGEAAEPSAGGEPPAAVDAEAAPAAAPPAPSAHRVGIAQFFTEADSRTARRDRRAYEATRVLAEGEEPSRQGYDLVLAGRLKKLPDGRSIACRAVSADAPPECVVSALFDEVRIEAPGDGRAIGRWTG